MKWIAITIWILLVFNTLVWVAMAMVAPKTWQFRLATCIYVSSFLSTCVTTIWITTFD